MELQVQEFRVTREGLEALDWYIIFIRPDMEFLGLALEEYLFGTAGSEYTEKVMGWFNDCAESGVPTAFNVGNGSAFVDRWTIRP